MHRVIAIDRDGKRRENKTQLKESSRENFIKTDDAEMRKPRWMFVCRSHAIKIACFQRSKIFAEKEKKEIDNVGKKVERKLRSEESRI